MKNKDKYLYWRSHVKLLFEEIIENGGPHVRIMDKPLRITYTLLQEAAQRAIEIQDEKLIAIFCRLAMYKESDPNDPEYNETKMAELYEKHFVTTSQKQTKPQ